VSGPTLENAIPESIFYLPTVMSSIYQEDIKICRCFIP